MIYESMFFLVKVFRIAKLGVFCHQIKNLLRWIEMESIKQALELAVTFLLDEFHRLITRDLDNLNVFPSLHVAQNSKLLWA
jgi:hypothetical protein